MVWLPGSSLPLEASAVSFNPGISFGHFEEPAEVLQRVSAHEGVAAGHEGGHGRHSDLSRFLELGKYPISISLLLKGLPEARGIQPEPGGDSRQDVG